MDASEVTCHGSCLCGAVRYRATGSFRHMAHCHCSMCRKAHGSAFATFVAVPAAGFEWLGGVDRIARYRSSARGRRHFCRYCGCLCGRVRFRLHGTPLLLVNCHCSRCRKGRGAAHATNLFVRPDQFEWLAGEADVVVFDLPGAERFGVNFCPQCGGPVPRGSPKIDRVNVPAGALDGDPGITVGYHIYVGSKAPWFAIGDDLPQHREAAPAATR